MSDKPHDRFFKTMFQQQEHARAHLEAYLPDGVCGSIALDTLTAAPTQHVDRRLEPYEK